METAINIVLAGLRVIEAVAPSIAMAITGGRSIDETAAAAHDAFAKLKNREDAGTWDSDLASRTRNG